MTNKAQLFLAQHSAYLAWGSRFALWRHGKLPNERFVEGGLQGADLFEASAIEKVLHKILSGLNSKSMIVDVTLDDGLLQWLLCTEIPRLLAPGELDAWLALQFHRRQGLKSSQWSLSYDAHPLHTTILAAAVPVALTQGINSALLSLSHRLGSIAPVSGSLLESSFGKSRSTQVICTAESWLALQTNSGWPINFAHHRVSKGEAESPSAAKDWAVQALSMQSPDANNVTLVRFKPGFAAQVSK